MSEFLNKVQGRMRLDRKSIKTQQAYVYWIKSFIVANNKRHPLELTAKDVECFLSGMADTAAKSTQKQAYFALKFLYEYLDRPLPKINAKRSKKLPQSRFALSKNDVVALINSLQPGVNHIIGSILYGSGLRVSECASLRIKDIDITGKTIIVRQGKHNLDRITILPDIVADELQRHINYIKSQQQADAENHIPVVLPGALNKKYPSAQYEWGWSWLFPSTVKDGFRQHKSSVAIQKMIKKAGESLFPEKNITCHILRHTFATHYLENGGRIDELKELMGHKSAETTLQYIHVGRVEHTRSPLDTK